MPTTVQASILGVVQGATEFLPVSSSAHLILARAFFGFDADQFGLAFDESPVRSAEQRLAALPDYDRIWFAFGGQWRASEAARLDLGAAWLYVKDTEIDNDQREEGRGRVTGAYDSGVWVLGAQYSMSF